MSSNRLTEYVKEHNQPEPEQRQALTHGFMFLPVIMGFGRETPFMAWQRHVYEQAFKEAQAVVRPSILERRLLECWN